MAIKHFDVRQNILETNVSNDLITKLYNICKKQDLGYSQTEFDNESILVGTINIPHTYQEYIDKIQEYFPQLQINTSGTYILFEDQEVLNVLLNAGLGDGVGITRTEAKTSQFSRDLFKGNTSITSFNNFNLFEKQNTLNTSFKDCTNLESINLSNLSGVPYADMFRNCSNLTYIDDLGSITKISNHMFNGCVNLTSINIPSTVKIIGDGAFYNNTSLTIQLNNIQNIEEFYGYWAFNATIDCGQNQELYLSSCKILHRGAFQDHKNIKYINLPNLEYLSGWQTFKNMTSLIEVKSLGNITEIQNDAMIGEGSFIGCTSLEKIVLPQGFTKLPDFAFNGCTNLTTIENLDMANLVEIGNRAFNQCNKLPKVFNLQNLTYLPIFGGGFIYNQSIYIPKVTTTYKGTKYSYWNRIPSDRVFGANDQIVKLSTIYFRDIQSFGFGTFCRAEINTVIINNVTPPGIDTHDDNNPNTDIYNELLFVYDNNGDIDNPKVTNIYVPDSAVEAYKAHSCYANVVDKIKPLSECPRITIEQALTGTPGLIEEYM